MECVLENTISQMQKIRKILFPNIKEMEATKM